MKLSKTAISIERIRNKNSCILICVIFNVGLYFSPPFLAIADESIHSLIKDLQQDSFERYSAISNLRKMGPKANDAVPALIQLFKIENRELQLRTVNAISDIGDGAIPHLINAIQDKNRMVRIYTVYTLANFRQKVQKIGPSFIKAMQDEDPLVRKAVIKILGDMRLEAKDFVPLLIQSMQDDDDSVGESAIRALGKYGPDAKDAVPELIQALKDVRRVSSNIAQDSLVRIGEVAVPALVKALKNENRDIQEKSKFVLVRIGKIVIPALIEAMKDKSKISKSNAAKALAKFGPEAENAVSTLIIAMQDEDDSVKLSAILALGEIGPDSKDAVPGLIRVLQDKNNSVRERAMDALGKIGPEAKKAVPGLIRALQEKESYIRNTAAIALGNIGRDPNKTVPALIKAMQYGDNYVRISAIRALGEIGPDAKDAITALIVAMQDKNILLKSNAAEALSKLGSEAKKAVPALIKAMWDKDIRVRQSAMKTLAIIGPDAKDAIPELVKILQNKDIGGSYGVAQALVKLSTGLQDVGDTSVIPNMKEAWQALAKHPVDSHRVDAESIRRSIKHLEALRKIEQKELWHQISIWMDVNPIKTKIFLLYGFFPLTVLLIYVLKPVYLLSLNQILTPANVKLKVISASFNYLLLLRVFLYRDRVLDAWVNGKLARVRERFGEIETVKQREVHIPIPVDLENGTIPNLASNDLEFLFSRSLVRLLITGEGGTGKTSLACQLGKWGMAEDKADRLSDHWMLPVFIEQDLDDLVKAVRGQLKEMLGEEDFIPDELLNHLLKRKRILVIVDHLSEMSSDSRNTILPELPNSPVNALVITSRLDEDLGLNKSVLEPLMVKGGKLSTFMEAYLTKRKKRQLFDDEEYFDGCRKISAMVGERDVTVLFAKLFAEQMIYIKDAEVESPFEASFKLPDNLPDLMVNYINWLNRNRQPDHPENRTVLRDAKIVAWECLRKRFRPSPAEYETVKNMMDGEDSETRLKYLEEKIQLIQTVGVSEDDIRLSLDPLAEYLASLQVIEVIKNDEGEWKNFLEESDLKEGAPEAIKGFLLALLTCCERKGEKFDIPLFVFDGLRQRVGIDQDLITKAKLQQRILKLTKALHTEEVNDRKYALNEFSKMGPSAFEVLPDMIEALRDPENEVRKCAANAIGSIGQNAKLAVPNLIELLKDSDESCRFYAIEAIRKMGQEAMPAVPALLNALSDDDFLVRSSSGKALGEIRPIQKFVVPALIEKLKHSSSEIRSSSANAIGEIGPDAKLAIPYLIEAFKDPYRCLRSNSASALGNIDNGSEIVVNALIEGLSDPDFDVRLCVRNALGKIGKKSSSVISKLIKLLGNSDVRRFDDVVQTLGNIGPSAKEAVPVLIRYFENEINRSPFIFPIKIIDTLADIGPSAKEAVPYLIEALKEAKEYGLSHLIRAIGEIGIGMEKAVPDFINALKDPDEEVRKISANVLGKLGPKAKLAVPALRQALKDPDPDIQEAARSALKLIE